MKKIAYCFVGFLFFSFFACKNSKPVDFEVEVKRLDRIYTVDAKTVNFQDYSNQYGYFWEVYTQNVIPLPEDYFTDSLLAFQQEKDFASAFNQVNRLYADFSPFQKQLSYAFYNYNKAFPNKIIPSIVTFFGGFNYIAIATDSSLGLGLEMFLGNDSEYYSKLTHKFPIYMHQQFQADYLTSVAMNGWLESEYPTPFEDFLTQMIHHGKIKYSLNSFLPVKSSHITMGYSLEQIKWCESNEFSIWKFLIEEGLLYSRDQFVISKYIKPAPYSKGMPIESPGQVAVWVGWKIVNEFMQNRPEISIEQLFAIDDAQYILNESKYKP